MKNLVPLVVRDQSSRSEVVLASTFLCAVFFVGIRTGHENIIRLHVDYIFYPIFFLYAAKLVLSKGIFDVPMKLSNLTLSAAMLFLTVASIAFQMAFTKFETEGALWLCKYIALIFIIINLSKILTLDGWVELYVLITKVSIIFVYISFALGLAGITAGADIWDGVIIRPHGLYSEPSNLCWTLPFLALYAWGNKNFKLMAVALSTIALVQSPTVLLVLFVSFIIYSYFMQSFIVKVAILLAVFCSFGFFALLGEGYSGDILSTGFLPLDRLLLGLLALNQGSGSGNARWDLLLQWWEFVINNPWIIFIGLGPGVSNAYTFDIAGGMTLDTNIFSAMTNAYGIIAPLLAIVYTLHVLGTAKITEAAKLLLICLLVSSIINVSGVFWQITYILFLLIVRNHIDDLSANGGERNRFRN